MNAALAGLTVTFRTDRNATYQVQTIADDRLRDASGTLTAGANGGTLNQPATPGRGAAATAVDATEYNWYSASVPEKSGNLSAASVTIRASEINDPGTLTVTNPTVPFMKIRQALSAAISWCRTPNPPPSARR